MKNNSNYNRKQFLINLLLVISYVVFLFTYCSSKFYDIWKEYSTFYLFVVYMMILILTYEKKDKKKIVILSILFIILGLNSLFCDYTIGSCVSVLNVFLVLFTVDKIRTNKFFLNLFKIITTAMYLLFIISNHSFLNTNFVGYIFFLYYLLFTNIFDLYNGNILKKIINVILLMLTVYYGNVYECRTVQLVTIIIFVIQSFFSKILSLNFAKRLLPYILTIGSLINAYVYVYLWKINFTIDLSSFATKSLYSGRNRIWNECFELIRTHPIAGVGANYSLQSHFAYALHNSMMMIITTFGIPVFILFVFSFKEFINNLYEKYSNNRNFLLLIITVIAIFFVDFFESYFYWSLFNFISFMIISLSINRDLNKNDK